MAPRLWRCVPEISFGCCICSLEKAGQLAGMSMAVRRCYRSGNEAVNVVVGDVKRVFRGSKAAGCGFVWHTAKARVGQNRKKT
jgi:hypothetical protein